MRLPTERELFEDFLRNDPTDAVTIKEAARLKAQAEATMPAPSVTGRDLAIAIIGLLNTIQWTEEGDLCDAGQTIFKRLDWIGRAEEARRELRSYEKYLFEHIEKGNCTDREYAHYQ